MRNDAQISTPMVVEPPNPPYPEHNLVRTKAQYKLLQSIEQQYEEMCNIIKNI